MKRKPVKNIWPFGLNEPLGHHTTIKSVKSRKVSGVVAHYKGYSIWKYPDGEDGEYFVIPKVDKDTHFESLKEAKRYLSNPPKKDVVYLVVDSDGNILYAFNDKKEAKRSKDAFGKRGIRVGVVEESRDRVPEHLITNPSSTSMKDIGNFKVSKQSTRKVENIRNPSLAMEEAAELSRKFHGREPREVIKFEEIEKYDKDLAILGDLLELNILTDNGSAIIPIKFAPEYDGQYTKESVRNGLGIKVCSNVECTQIYFKDGNQTLDLAKLFKSGLYSGESSFNKQWCIVGPVYSIVYFTDKSHLTGPEYQKKGTAYEHSFGEEKDGELPYLMYETINKRLALSGGSYEIRPEGIWN